MNQSPINAQLSKVPGRPTFLESTVGKGSRAQITGPTTVYVRWYVTKSLPNTPFKRSIFLKVTKTHYIILFNESKNKYCNS